MRRAALPALLLACASAPPAPAAPPPKWWPRPAESLDLLYFAGEADASDDGEARSLARAAALRALDAELGVTVASTCSDRVGQRGATDVVEVECTTTVGGAPRALRGLRLEAVQSGASGDGKIRAYALLSWPRVERAALEAQDAARAAAALEAFARADAALEERSFQTARLAIDAARTALGQTELRLDHPTIKSAKQLHEALAALEARIASEESAHGKVCAVGLRCKRDGAELPCRDAHVGALRSAVSGAGRQLAPSGLPAPLLSALLDAGSVPRSAQKEAACLVAFEVASELLEVAKPFTFVRASARAVLYDTAAGKIVWSDAIPPEKMGHVSYEEAMNKGFDAVEKKLADRLGDALRGAR